MMGLLGLFQQAASFLVTKRFGERIRDARERSNELDAGLLGDMQSFPGVYNTVKIGSSSD